MLNAQQQQDIMQHANFVAPEEACGFVLGDGSVMPCKNVHPQPKLHFRISAADRAKAETIGIKALYHSHVSGWRDFSPDDIQMSRRERMPLILYVQSRPQFLYFDPSETLPYVEREFHFAYRNCYELIRDWYAQELGIHLKECYPIRPDIWDEPDFNPIALINPLEQGFVPLPKDAPLQQHDVFQMRIGRQKRACHLGVLIDPNRNHFLHHLSNRLSEISVYGGDWWEDTEQVWRHHNLC